MADERLALLGGTPTCRASFQPVWPVTTERDINAITDVLGHGILVADRNVTTPVDLFEKQWACYTGAKHCIAVSNGTVAIELSLRALDISSGDEVIVPALSFVASAMAVAMVGATPVYVDIDEQTYNLNPDLLEDLITARTKAIVVVHLHGRPADMDAVLAVAERHGLPVIEDAAQAQGAWIGSRHCGTLGKMGTFSLQMTKNLPTCGEGGMIVTDDASLKERLLRLRQFGELITPGEPRSYVSSIIGTNGKLGSIQAAYSSSQLQRFPREDAIRKTNVSRFLDELADLPHLVAPTAGDDGTHAWHILRFGVNNAGPLDQLPPRRRRQVLMKALVAEGIPVSRYQTLPLPDQPALKPLVHQHKRDWAAATRVINNTFALQQRHLHPDSGPLLQGYAEGFRKVFRNLQQLLELTS